MTNRPPAGYSAGHFALALDQGNNNQNPGMGNEPAYLRSIEGGFYQGSIIAEALGADLHQVKHLGMVDPQPIKFEAGLASSRELLEWIKESWTHTASFRSGRIDHGSPWDGKIRNHYAQVFWDALIAQVTFPAMSASASSGSPFLSVEVQPGNIKLLDGDDLPMQVATADRQLSWSKASFRLELEGEVIKAKKIDALSVKQHMKKLYTGRSRLPELVPASLEVSNLAVYSNPSDSKYFLDWYDERIATGAKETSQERSGAIIFQSTDGVDLFELTLSGVGLYSLNLEKSVANAKETKQFKTGLYIEHVELKINSAFD